MAMQKCYCFKLKPRLSNNRYTLNGMCVLWMVHVHTHISKYIVKTHHLNSNFNSPVLCIKVQNASIHVLHVNEIRTIYSVCEIRIYKLDYICGRISTQLVR